MSEYRLYCFAQSGNCYRAALMLNLIGAYWEPVWVDFFDAKTQRSTAYREQINELGEVPVLVHGARKYSQSGVILTYLANAFGKFLPADKEAEYEALRWLLFDNQKVNGFLGPYRFLRNWAAEPNPGALAYLKEKLENNLDIVERRLSSSRFLLGSAPTIADISLAGYFFYPPEEFGFDITDRRNRIREWKNDMRELPGWRHPYDLMPSGPVKLGR